MTYRLLYVIMANMSYLTVSEVAKIYRIKEFTVYEWIKLGKIKAIRKGKKWLIPADENNIDEQI